MLDNLTQLQQAVQQRRSEQRRSGLPHWLIVLDRLRRLATCLGLLIILGVIGSITWPYIRHLQQEHTKPAAETSPATQSVAKPAVSQPAGVVSPAHPVAAVPATQPQPAVTTANEPPLDTIETHRLGQIFTIGTWEYRVTGRQWREPAAAESPAAPGHKFLTIFLAARNTGHETVLLPAPRLAGLDGVRYDPRMIASPSTAAAGQPIGPRIQQVCQFTFEVPGVKAYKVLLPAGWLSDKYAAVEITP